jgi:hypothetical protein
MADAKVTKLFDEREIAVRVEEIASKAVDRFRWRFCWRGRSRQPWSAAALQGGEPRSLSDTVDLGIANDFERPTQIAIALFADAPEPWLACARDSFPG